MPYRSAPEPGSEPEAPALEDILADACGFPREARRTLGASTAELRAYSPPSGAGAQQAQIALVGARLTVRLAPSHAFCRAMRALRIETGHRCPPGEQTRVWELDVESGAAAAVFAAMPDAFEPDHHEPTLLGGTTVRGFLLRAGASALEFESYGRLLDRQRAFAYRLVGLARNAVLDIAIANWAKSMRFWL